MNSNKLKVTNYTPTSVNSATDSNYGKVALLLNGSGGNVLKDSSSYNRTFSPGTDQVAMGTGVSPSLDSSNMLFGNPMYKFQYDARSPANWGIIPGIRLDTTSITNLTVGTSEVCAEAFIKIKSGYIFNEYYTNAIFQLGNSGVIIEYRKTRCINCLIIASSVYQFPTPDNSILDDILYHVVLTRDNTLSTTHSLISLFIDGTLSNAMYIPKSTSISPPSINENIIIGRPWPDITFWVGSYRFTNGNARYRGGDTLNTKYFDVPTTAFLSSDIASDPANSIPYNDSYIDVTVAKNNVSIIKRIYVKKKVFPYQNYSLEVYPGVFNLGATADGEVYPESYNIANINASILKGSSAQSLTDWTITAVPDSEGLTITPVTIGVNGLGEPSANFDVIGLSKELHSAKILLMAARPEYPTLFNTVTIGKNLDSTTSGLEIGVKYLKFATTQPIANAKIYILFKSSGAIHVKKGISGSYVDSGAWYRPVNTVTQPGATRYMRMSYTSESTLAATLVPVGAATTDTVISLSTDREYYLEGSVAGFYRVKINPEFGDSVDGIFIQGEGALELTVE